MKLGIILSLILVVLAVVIGIAGFYGVAEDPTAATRPERLQKLEFSSSLQPLFTPSQPQTDAAELYGQIFDYYQDHIDEFSRETPRQSLVDQLCDMMVSAMNCGRVQQGFLDKAIAIEPGALPSYGDALEVIPLVVLQKGQKEFEGAHKGRALELAKSVWALGRRAYSDNIRLYNRRNGLAIMVSAGDYVFQWSQGMDPKEIDTLTNWAQRLNEIQAVFHEKDELIGRLEPHVGDLLNIAVNDQDVGFRVEAILKLGILKYSPGSRGNSRVIRRTIAQAAKDSDPNIAKAGAAADKFTLDQLRSIR